jgi:glycerol kinase
MVSHFSIGRSAILSKVETGTSREWWVELARGKICAICRGFLEPQQEAIIIQLGIVQAIGIANERGKEGR